MGLDKLEGDLDPEAQHKKYMLEALAQDMHPLDKVKYGIANTKEESKRYE